MVRCIYYISTLTFGHVTQTGSTGYVDGDGRLLVVVVLDVNDGTRQRRSTVRPSIGGDDRQFNSPISLVIDLSDDPDHARVAIDIDY